MPQIQIGKFKFNLVKAITVSTILIGLIVGLVEGIIIGVREYDKYKELQKEVVALKKDKSEKDALIIKLQSELTTIHKFMESKETSFAVGFRVIVDKTGKRTKGYRRWNGVTEPLYKDGQMSSYYGVDSYFWVDSTGVKHHVW
jgi:hypothetical protein